MDIETETNLQKTLTLKNCKRHSHRNMTDTKAFFDNITLHRKRTANDLVREMHITVERVKENDTQRTTTKLPTFPSILKSDKAKLSRNSMKTVKFNDQVLLVTQSTQMSTEVNHPKRNQNEKDHCSCVIY